MILLFLILLHSSPLFPTSFITRPRAPNDPFPSLRRGLSHGGSNDSMSMSSYRSTSPWDIFYEHNDISISELISPTADNNESCTAMLTGTFCADCNVSLSPKEIRHILLHYPERIDGLMTRRRVLNRLNDETFVQVPAILYLKHTMAILYLKHTKVF